MRSSTVARVTPAPYRILATIARSRSSIKSTSRWRASSISWQEAANYFSALATKQQKNQKPRTPYGTTTAKEILIDDVSLGIGGRRPSDGCLHLRGEKGHLDGVEAKLQPANLAGGFGIPAASIIRPADELTELPLVVVQ
jgi:hypothetical protein